MKTALIFPGQGSQFIGMGFDFYNEFKVSRDIFDLLNQILDRNLSQLVFSGDISDLSMTENSQPAIMATSIAIFQAIVSENLLQKDSIACVAGHSLGEYSALVANNSLKFIDSLKLLQVRAKAMQDSMPVGTGGMVALIGCEIKDIEKIISDISNYGRIYIANDNAVGQVVLSGEIKAIEYIVSNYKELEIKRAIKLPVSAPFHCELMQNASKIINNEIPKYNFMNFKMPLYSNVTAEICDETNIGDLLVKQIVSKVRWREIIENMIRDGIKNFIEIGPGNVLTNLIRRISKNVNTISISNISDLKKIESLMK